MTEQEWIEGTEVGGLIEHLRANYGIARTKAGKRRLRLFSCACIRRAWPLLDADEKAIVEGLERVCEGVEPAATLKGLEARSVALARAVVRANRWDIAQALHFALGTFGSPSQCAALVASAIARAQAVAQATRAGQSTPDGVLGWHDPGQAEYRALADPLRDIFGNPFRPLSKRKFSAELRGLAQTCAADDWSAGPMLADALTDLGEDAAADHLRQEVHVLGCHVIDWVRGVA